MQEWRAQIRSAVRSLGDIDRLFPHLPSEWRGSLSGYLKKHKIQLTPYLLGLMKMDGEGNPDPSDPVVRCFFPTPELITAALESGAGDHANTGENWALAEHRPTHTKNLEHVYSGSYGSRVLGRMVDGCLGICPHCFEAERTISKNQHLKRGSWQETLEYLRDHPEVNEFIVSGGDPLLMPDELIESRLSDLRKIKSIRIIRLHTAAFMHCPMRMTTELASILKAYNVSVLGMHIVHPRFLTPEFDAALERMRSVGYAPLINAQTPLLKRINDKAVTLAELFTGLTERGIRSYYLLHCMPGVVGAQAFRTPVHRLIGLLDELGGRGFSQTAVPKPTIVARGGKINPEPRGFFWLERHQVERQVWAIDDTYQSLVSFAVQERGDMLQFDGSPKFIYSYYQGEPVVVFRNWQGEWEMYLDAR